MNDKIKLAIKSIDYCHLKYELNIKNHLPKVPDLKDRYGKITITRALLRQEPETIPHIIKLLGFVPWKVEYLFHNDKLELTGVSPQFEISDPASKPPKYQIIIHSKKNKVTGLYDITKANAEKII